MLLKEDLSAETWLHYICRLFLPCMLLSMSTSPSPEQTDLQLACADRLWGCLLSTIGAMEGEAQAGFNLCDGALGI